MTPRAQTTIRLPSELLDALRKESEIVGTTLNGLVRQILWDWLNAR